MELTRRLRMVAAIVPAFAVQVATGCSTNGGDDPIARSTAPIIGGVADNTNLWAVGIDVGGGGICSGSLIAPNLVLTARHCVSKTPESLDCRPDGGLATNKILGNYPASAFRVTTANKVGSSPQWTVRAVRYIEDPNANRLCGFDLALLELNKNASGAFPTSWVPPSLVGPLKKNYTAIGYGCQTAEKPGGGGCDPRGVRMLLEGARVIEVSADEFVISGRVCGGDSGGPIWDRTANVIFGALSRGDGSTSTMEGCNFGIYTRADFHLDWLQKYGKTAATNGGYAPLPWMTATKPAPMPDAGMPPPEKSPIGARCAGSVECESGLCVEFGGGDKRCSRTCTDATPCPSGFMCTAGYCYPGEEPPPEDAAPPVEEDAAASDDAAVNPANDVVKGGTCAVATDYPPPKPQPWIAVGLVGLGIALLRRRFR